MKKFTIAKLLSQIDKILSSLLGLDKDDLDTDLSKTDIGLNNTDINGRGYILSFKNLNNNDHFTSKINPLIKNIEIMPLFKNTHGKFNIICAD